MTDQSSDQTTASLVPSLKDQIISAMARHLLTAVAGYLAAQGVLTSDKQEQFVTMGGAIAVWGAGVLLSCIQKKFANSRLKVAINATPPSTPVK